MVLSMAMGICVMYVLGMLLLLLLSVAWLQS
jgi:hypothetical protein